MEENKLTPAELMVIGGSAGSLDIILQLLPLVQKNLSFAIIIVLHRQASQPSLLERLFASKTSLSVREAEEKDLIVPGIIYIAPPDYHLLIEKDKSFSMDFSEKINFSRPSIDVTFQAAAETYKEGLIGILLSGANSDGVEGLKIVKKYGGITIVQDPRTAIVSFMPQAAIENMQVDHILSMSEIAAFINRLSVPG